MAALAQSQHCSTERFIVGIALTGGELVWLRHNLTSPGRHALQAVWGDGQRDEPDTLDDHRHRTRAAKPDRSGPAVEGGAVNYRSMLRNAWLVPLITLIAVGAAALYTMHEPPVYRATLKMVVGQANSFFQPDAANATEPLTQTVAALLKSDLVARQVISQLQLDIEPSVLSKNLAVSSEPSAAVLDVSYDDSDPAQVDVPRIPVIRRAAVVTERSQHQAAAAVHVADSKGLTGRPPAVGQVAKAGLHFAARRSLDKLRCLGQRGFQGALDIGELRKPLADGFLRRVGRRPGCHQGQPAQQRPKLLPVIVAPGQCRAQRCPRLLSQCAQPLGWMKTDSGRAQAIVELVTDDLAGLRLRIGQASRPGEGAGLGENALMGIPPPCLGQRAASQAISQFPECRRPARICLRVPGC